MPVNKNRLVIDTNLWISFLLTKDFTKLDHLLSAGHVTLLISQELLEEIIEVALRPKFRKYFDFSDLTDLITGLQQKAELVEVNSRVKVCRDPKDDFLLSLAVDGSATHILTGDKDLLILHPFNDIEIVTVANYFAAN